VGDVLSVSADIERRYTPADINRVDVTTADLSAVYRTSGIISLAIGGSFTGLSFTTFIVAGVGSDDAGRFVVPTVLAVAGAPGLIIGTVLLSKAKHARSYPLRAMPEMILSPTGATLQGTF